MSYSTTIGPKELLTIRQLLRDEQTLRKSVSFLKEDYFQSEPTRVAFRLISQHFKDHNEPLPQRLLAIGLHDFKGAATGEDFTRQTLELLGDLSQDKHEYNHEATLQLIQDWAHERAVFNASMNFITLTQDGAGSSQLIAALDDVKDAVHFSFNNSVGWDLDDIDEYIAETTQRRKRIKTNNTYLDQITDGGFPERTLNVFAGVTNVGKTALMVGLSCEFLKQGYKVAYLSIEMSCTEMMKRHYANLGNHEINDLSAGEALLRPMIMKALKAKDNGKLKIQEFPPSCTTSDDLNQYLDNLKEKLDFEADVVFVDYANLMTSHRVNSNSGHHLVVKSVAEELRAIAVKRSVPIITATQLNRQAYGNSRPGLENSSDSMGLPMTADFMAIITRDMQDPSANTFTVFQDKNRYTNKSDLPQFTLGFNFSKHQIYDTTDAELNKTFEIDPLSKFSDGWATKPKRFADFSY